MISLPAGARWQDVRRDEVAGDEGQHAERVSSTLVACGATKGGSMNAHASPFVC
jgi:hypothetical protein